MKPRMWSAKSQLAPLSRIWARTRKTGDDCWIWTGAKDRWGYGRVSRGRSHDLSVHRVAWSLTFGDIPAGMFVLHRCDNRACINPSHLFLGTQDDNMKDMVRKGRSLLGNKNPRRRNTRLRTRMLKILEASTTGRTTQRELAKRFAVNQSTISRILNGKRWNGGVPRPLITSI